MYGRKSRILSRTTVISILGVLSSMVLFGAPAVHALAHSSSIAYVTDFGTGICDTSGPGSGSSILDNAVTGAAATGCPGGPFTYTTGVNPFATVAGGNTVTFTNIAVAAVNAGGVGVLTPFDTVISYEVCDIGSAANANYMAALNAYLTGGHGKLIILDGDRCSPISAGSAVYDGSAGGTAFIFPFTSSNPGPRGFVGVTTFQEAEVLPAVLSRAIPVGFGSGTDAIGDSNTFTTHNPAWCEAIGGTNGFGVTGAQLAYATSVSSGGAIPTSSLVIWNGWDQWFTFGANKPDAQAFDNMLDQPFNPDSLPCSVIISHGAPEFPLGTLAMIGLMAPAILLLRKRITASPLAR